MAATLMAAILLSAPVMTSVSGASAADQELGVTQSGNVTAYDAAYFGPFSPITAEDILKRIPGIQDVLTAANTASTQRGFGSTGAQILFNGRRLSGKSMTVGSALQRIQAGQVTRVEVIRGDAAGMDVRSDGVLVNLVLSESLSAGTGSWEGRVSYWTNDVVKPGGKLSYAGVTGALSYVLGVEVNQKVDGRTRTGIHYLPGPPGAKDEQIRAQAPLQYVMEEFHWPQTEYVGTASLTYSFANGDIFNGNGRLARRDMAEYNTTDTYAPTLTTFVSRLINRRELKETAAELGADYEHTFTNGDSLKVLGIYTRTPQTDLRDFFSGVARAPTRIQRIFPKSQEKIVRGTWRHAFNGQHSIEAGAEAAFNSLASHIERVDYVGGAQVNVALFNPEGSVKETRLETFTSWSWRAGGGVTVDVAADTETSKLKQRGRDVSSDKSFFFLKPRLDVRYNIAPRHQLRFKAQRTVSQLDFVDFLPGFNTEPTRLDVIRAGNPDLVPEKRWLWEAVYEYRLPSDQGTLSARAYYVDITDYIEQIPVDTSTVSATGNIDKAKDYAVELKADVRLSFIGLPTARVDVTYQRRGMRVNDPFDGALREFPRTQVGFWELGYRHDTAWRNLAYGFRVVDRMHHVSPEPDNFGTLNMAPTISAFIEGKVVGDVLVRLEGFRLGDKAAPNVRQVFTRRRGLPDAVPRRYEYAGVKFPSEVRLTVRGTF